MRVQHAWLSARKWGSIPTGSAGLEGRNKESLEGEGLYVRHKSHLWAEFPVTQAEALSWSPSTQSDGVMVTSVAPTHRLRVRILVALPQIVDRLAVSVV